MPKSEFWRGRRVLLTGHTGFKGAWAWTWLTQLGAAVTGFSLPAETSPSLAHLLGVDAGSNSIIGDIRDPDAVTTAVAQAKPQIVLHLAAQALVRRSYVEPIETFDTNVIGTLRVLEAIRSAPDIEACLVITSDKVYENTGSGRAYVETDPLGGHDPYSASKATCEIAVASYASSFFKTPVSTARAGNVIGGGDWSKDRIIPDIWRACRAGEAVRLRYPRATRPWQHVLEPLAGYFDFVEAMVAGLREPTLNFGPHNDMTLTVSEVVDAFLGTYGKVSGSGWIHEGGQHLQEAATLAIDASRAANRLPWRPRLSAAEAIAWTAHWYAAYDRSEDMSAFTRAQIAAFEDRCL